MSSRDPNPKRPVTVESVPSGEAQVTTSSVLVPAASRRVFIINNIPADSALNLWNFLWNIYVDTDDPAYDYFEGTLTDANAKVKLVITENLNWAYSSDRANTRVHCIAIMNNDTIDYTVYLKYKAYTFVGVNG